MQYCYTLTAVVWNLEYLPSQLAVNLKMTHCTLLSHWKQYEIVPWYEIQILFFPVVVISFCELLLSHWKVTTVIACAQISANKDVPDCGIEALSDSDDCKLLNYWIMEVCCHKVAACNEIHYLNRVFWFMHLHEIINYILKVVA